MPECKLRAAMEAHDLAAVAAAFAPDAVLHSPITDGITFHGRHDIAALCGVLMETLEDLRYRDELIAQDRGFLLATARVQGLALEIVDHLRFDADGLIVEMTAYFRPLPAAAVAMRVIGAGLARQRSAARGMAVSVLAWPLTVATQVGDRIGVALVG